MFQFPKFALPTLCIQVRVTLAGRVSPFRHPRIKAYCQLPVAFRRLSRLSSPVIAKASTTCTYSLDPIILSPQHLCQSSYRTSLVSDPSRLNNRSDRYNQKPIRILHTLSTSQTVTYRWNDALRMQHTHSLLLPNF